MRTLLGLSRQQVGFSPEHLWITTPFLPLLLPFLCESGCVSVSLGARTPLNSNNSQSSIFEGDPLRIGRSAVQPRPWPPG
jgi:hypothetical protein